MKRVVFLVAIVVLAGYLPAIPHTASAAAPTNWLARLNFYRALANLPAATENTSWTQGDINHSRWMVENGTIAHDELSCCNGTSNPWYTDSGHHEGINSNIYVSSTTAYQDSMAIDGWMASPFHQVGILDPRLAQTSYGAFRDGTRSPWQYGGTLNVGSGLTSSQPAGITYPLTWPADKSVMPITSYPGGEWPDPLTSCSGYGTPTGAPVILMLGPNVLPDATGARTTVLADGAPVDACEFDGSNYVNPDANTQRTGRIILANRGAIVIMPRNPYVYGHSYQVVVQVNGSPISWSFTAGDNPTALLPGRPYTGGSVAVGAQHGASVAYFAEGYTGVGFQEYATVLNLQASAIDLDFEYIEPSAPPFHIPHHLNASARLTVDVNKDVGLNHSVGLVITGPSGSLFVAERPMYFTYGGGINGGHDVVGAQSLAKSFYFAEGSTQSGIHEYLTLLNPNATAANVSINYYYPGAGYKATPSRVVPANSRLTVSVNDAAEAGAGRDVSARVVSDTPILAERPMYFLFASGLNGGHTAVGSAAPGTSFSFAEGYVDSAYTEFYSVFNPDPTSPAHVVLTFQLPGGNTRAVPFDLAAGQRTTLKVNDILPSGTSNAAVLTASIPVLAERPMYFTMARGGDGGHVAPGTPTATLGSTWYFAEGYTGPTVDEFYTLLNPSSSTTVVTITFHDPNGLTYSASRTLPPHSRDTVHANDVLPSGTNNSAVVTSSNNVAILVERPMYFSY